MQPITSHWNGFDTLTRDALYALLQLRSDVFIVEQQSAYADIDGRDQAAMHLRLLREGVLLAAARVFAPDMGGSAAIGRVVVAKEARGLALGRRLMQETVAFCDSHYPGHAITLSAQNHLRAFYQSFGFEAMSDIYIEDGIPHVDMVRPAA